MESQRRVTDTSQHAADASSAQTAKAASGTAPASAGQPALIEVLDYQPEHREYFERFNVEWLEKYFSVEPIDREIFSDPQKYVLDGGGHIFMGQLNGELVGTVALLPTGPGRFELAKMAVTEAAQGQQVGRQLVVACIEKARALGADALDLLTNSRLTRAGVLYRSLGFEVTQTGPNAKYKRVDTVMLLDLTAKPPVAGR